LGVAGGTGTGSGTGSGSGTGTGGGTGSGNGSGDGLQSKDAEPLLVPYSQIGFVKVVNPNYPELARRVGLQGQVVVRVTIDENGVPFAFHVLGGEELFVKETLRVLPRWRFTPVLHDGRKVRATFDAILRFNLA
jgi:TonB family protein